MQFFLAKFVGALPRDPTKMGPQKINFLMAQARVLVFFDISRYLTEKYFDIVWGCHPLLGDPPTRPLKNQLFEWLKLRYQCFMISTDI